MSSPPPAGAPDWRRRLEAVAAASKSVARDTAQNAGEAIRSRPRPQEPEESRFDPTGWYGALVVMAFVAGALWVIEVVNGATNYALTSHLGLRPREIGGLWGVFTAPYLHLSAFQLLTNTVPFVLIGWVVLMAGVRGFVITSATVTVLGGVLAWLVAPEAVIVGSGLLVIGWLGYLLARAVFSRSVKWIVVAVLVLFFFGTLLGALVPHFDRGISWEAYLAYFIGGVAAGALLHLRRRPRRPPRQSVREAFRDG